MNFALARRNYKGPLNFMAYIGLLGDLATVSGLYFLYRLKTMNSEEKKKIAEIQGRKENA